MFRQFNDQAQRHSYLWGMVSPESTLTPDEKEAFKAARRADLFQAIKHRLAPPEPSLPADEAVALQKKDPVAISEIWDRVRKQTGDDTLDLLARSHLWLGYYENFRLIMESDFFLIVMLLKSRGDPGQSRSAAERFGQAWEGAVPKLAQFVVDGLPTISDDKKLGSALGNISIQGSYNAHFPETRRFLRWSKEKKDLEAEIHSLESKNDRTEQETMRLDKCRLKLRDLEGKLRSPEFLSPETPAMTHDDDQRFTKLDKLQVLVFRLNKQQQFVLQMRHFTRPPSPWKEIASDLDCTVARAKQIYKEAKAALRRLWDADDGYFFLS